MSKIIFQQQKCIICNLLNVYANYKMIFYKQPRKHVKLPPIKRLLPALRRCRCLQPASLMLSAQLLSLIDFLFFTTTKAGHCMACI